MSYVDFKQLIDDVGHTLCRKLMCQIDVIDHEDVIT
jgi:hypothetical protein